MPDTPAAPSWVVVRVERRRAHLEYDEESGRLTRHVRLEVIDVIADGPLHYTDRYTYRTRVEIGAFMLRPEVSDLRKRGTEVVIV